VAVVLLAMAGRSWWGCWQHPQAEIDEILARALIAVVADDDLDDATVLVSVYEPDAAHGWTSVAIERILRGDGLEEAPR
jgi:hypothetical protein